MDTSASSGHPRRWGILAVAFFVSFTGGYSQFTLSGFGSAVTSQLGLSSSQLASLILAPMLPGVFLGFIGGGLADRFGVKRLIGWAYIVSIVGAVLRLFATNYAGMFVAMLFIGMAALFIGFSSAKLFGTWFGSAGVGVAMGIFTAAGGVSTAVAQSTVSFFPNVRSAYICGIVLLVIAFVAWLTVVPSDGRTKVLTADGAPAPSVRDSLRRVLRNRDVWLLGIGMVLFMGAQMTVSGFLPTALNRGKGLTTGGAGSIAALFTIGSLIGTVGTPYIARWVGRIKPVIIVGALVGMTSILTAWATAPGALSSVLLVVAGATVGSSLPLIMSAPALLPSVGPRNVGAAGGLIGTLQMAGAFVLPTLVIAPIAGTNYTLMFGLAALCCGLIAVAILLVPEYGARAQAKVLQPAESHG